MTDANVWIDLDEGNLLGHVFDLGDELVIPDLVFTELESLEGALLVELGLSVLGLSGDQLNDVVRLAGAYSRPSPQDLSTLVLARKIEAVLLTGDGALRDAAEAEGLEVHGVLWILDRMVDGAILTEPEAVRSLKLITRAGSRLPGDEVRQRLRRWGL